MNEYANMDLGVPGKGENELSFLNVELSDEAGFIPLFEQSENEVVLRVTRNQSIRIEDLSLSGMAADWFVIA